MIHTPSGGPGGGGQKCSVDRGQYSTVADTCQSPFLLGDRAYGYRGALAFEPRRSAGHRGSWSIMWCAWRAAWWTARRRSRSTSTVVVLPPQIIAGKGGKPVRVRARLHWEGAPWWRYWRGAVVRRADDVVWRAVVRRWRRVDLTSARVIGTVKRSSAADGDRVLVTLVGVSADHLAASPEAASVLEASLFP